MWFNLELFRIFNRSSTRFVVHDDFRGFRSICHPKQINSSRFFGRNLTSGKILSEGDGEIRSGQSRASLKKIVRS